ncbi:MAG: cation:proton antiporter [Candidatus Nanoarchaeia archaeon]
MADIFIELAIIIAIATIISAIMRILKQPMIIGYILTGLVAGPYLLNLSTSVETIEAFSQIGVALLLFIVGLSLSLKVIKEVGKTSLIVGLGQVIITLGLGFLLSKYLGFSGLTAFYIAMALTFSSTIIIMKLLSDKKDLENLYGKISIGLLLIQDLIAIILLVVISSFSTNLTIWSLVSITLIKGAILIGIIVLVSRYILPRLCNFFAKSQEFLFLFSIGWGLGLAALFNYFGFRIEMGALIAGVTLSLTPYHFEISSKMKPLRDFFLIIFFIFLGSQMIIGQVHQYIVPAIVLSLFVLIGKPFVVMIIMGVMGHSKRNGFLTGANMAQISEFSLIIVLIGISVGHVSQSVLSLITLVALITIAGSTYFIMYSNKVYPYIAKPLSVFEKKNRKKGGKEKEETYEAILFGYNRIGYDLLEALKKRGNNFLVVDYNPQTIQQLIKKGIRCKYGDAEDPEFYNELNLKNIKIALSTIPDFETNMLIIESVRRVNKKAIIIVISHDLEEANSLYKKGATYVLMPHFLGGHYAAMMITKYGLELDKFLDERKRHIEYLKKRKQMGHEHPKHERSR